MQVDLGANDAIHWTLISACCSTRYALNSGLVFPSEMLDDSTRSTYQEGDKREFREVILLAFTEPR